MLNKNAIIDPQFENRFPRLSGKHLLLLSWILYPEINRRDWLMHMILTADTPLALHTELNVQVHPMHVRNLQLNNAAHPDYSAN